MSIVYNWNYWNVIINDLSTMNDHHYTSRKKWEPNHYVDDVLAFRNIVKVVECYGFI